MSEFTERLSIATDETTQIQPLYRQEFFNAVKHSETVEVNGVFASNGKLVQNHIMRVARVFENGKYREAKLEDIAVGKTDGIFNLEYYKVNGKDSSYVGFVTLLECKLDQDFNDKAYRSNVILQVICYLKQLKEQGENVPEITLVGSKKNCFVLRGKYVEIYIDEDIQHYKSASTAYSYNPEIIDRLNKDDELHNSCYIYTIDNDFKMSNIVKDIYNYVSGNDDNRRLTDSMIAKAFDVFSMQILAHPEKVNPRNQAKYFLAIILTPDDCFVNPKKPNKLVIGTEFIDIIGEKYPAFREQFGLEKKYTIAEQRKFTAQADRLIEDADRRRRGDFYTPTVWVDEAHKLISKHLGNNWRNEYMVWDCCAGTCNLTRDYKFKELYSSTLIESDIELSKQYNINAVKFQYDFLNDDVEEFEELAKIKAERGYLTVADFIEKGIKLYDKAPGLVNGLLEGKKLLAYFNPPYAGAGEQGTRQGLKENKSGVASTKINSLMRKAKIGAASQQLYAQFVYRLLLFKRLFNVDVVIALYSKCAIQSSPSFEGFRKELYSELSMVDSMYFCASEFADCSSDWGVLFSIWNDARVFDAVNKTRICTVTENGGVREIGTKRLYNLDNKMSLTDWVKKTDIMSVIVDTLPLTSGLVYKSKNVSGTWYKDSLGYLYLRANNVENSQQTLALLTSVMQQGHGINIFKDMFKRSCVYFTARRLITGKYSSWVNGKDEYMIPNTEHSAYNQFEADSIVYSLFNNASNQSSLRNVAYNGKQWDIKNEFFWMGKDEIKALAQGKYDSADMNTDIERDIMDNADKERYVYNLLQTVTLSPDAQAVLDKATDLIKKSFKYRETVSQIHPEYHLQTWDMGYYQLNKLIQEIPTLSEEWKEFRALYKQLEDRMRPLVYELGFLYK